LNKNSNKNRQYKAKIQKYLISAVAGLEKTIDLKVVVLGEGGVGKTSMINAFLGNEIISEYLPTIGTVTNRKEYELPQESVRIRVNIWDFGGQRSFNPVNPVFFSNVDMALFVFDLSKSNETLKNIKNEFYEKVNSRYEAYISIIVGNKLDLFSITHDFKKAINNYLNERDSIILTSAKTGENIQDCFELLVYNYLKKAEILIPDTVRENFVELFLKLVGKDEKTFKSKIRQLSTMESALETTKPEIEEEKLIENHTGELKYYEFIEQELQKVRHQKSDNFDRFLINITELEETLKHLKKTRIKSVDGIINNLKDILNISRKEFEQNCELVQKLNLEENELMIIQVKLRKEKT
jgi:small GTP-binding protein